MFRGVHAINMDAKGRMAMPTKYRDGLKNSDDGQLIATIDIQTRCLLIYPLSVWEDIEQKLQKLPSLNASTRRLQRLMLGYASELELDGNGRVLLPAVLREYAGLEKKVVLVGQGGKFELWSDEQWAAETAQAIEDANSGDLDVPDDIQNLVF
ncbi:Transcriptional regulator MraZ [BD1-7 clade bacterium]|uniref:Transcriptional regulator MraZ n=1 Tax=BD1-7 clade bacterium TaxID=2029982 RepID=A0A5S9QD31_9GAMM|nr:Transcriptional regulator MraZ [BD1-7 clade bacterium]CAA0115324.1 Transcriptional regulator MraZ [BD1-7 clade bacterium]